MTITFTAHPNVPRKMPSNRLFLDTGFVVARFRGGDQYHEAARSLESLVSGCREMWTTDAVLFEIAAAFSHPQDRPIALRMWDRFHGDAPGYHSVPAAGAALEEAVELFRNRPDKSWSLTDCLSFVVMQEQNLNEALSADHHFARPGSGRC